MAKNYEIPEEESCMVSEAALAYEFEERAVRKTVPIFDRRSDNSAISGEQLKTKLHNSLRLRFS